MENLKIYNDLRSVPKEAQKSFNNGSFSGTDINPQWRIKKLTETFGPAGFGWYVEILHRHLEYGSDGCVCAFMAVNLYVKIDNEWSKPIYGEGGNTFIQKTKSGLRTSDEAFKMAYTDAISNATKQLGLGADIWFEKDVTKYTKDSQEEQSAQPKQVAPAHTPQTLDELGKTLKTALEEVAKSKNVTELQSVWNKYTLLQKNEAFKKEVTSKKKSL
jgi:hypothetical protein